MKAKLIKYFIALGSALALCLSAPRAMATVAANTEILNQATLQYDDGTGIQTVTASVAVTVSLVPGPPTLDSPPDQTSPYTGVDTQHPYTYTVTAGGNGPDTYTVGTSVASSTNTTGPSTAGDTSFLLGATVTTTGSSNTILQVPSDRVANGSVNGIEVNDAVVVNGEVRTVTAVSDPDSGTATITLGTGLSGAPGAGVPVLEQRTFSLNVLSGSIGTSGTDITVDVDTTVTNSAPGTTTDQVTSTYTNGLAVLDKYVRNVTDPAGNAGGTGPQSFTINGSTNNYYDGGVTGKTGDVLEYVLVVNNNGSGPLTDCTITDVLPTVFVSFSSDAYGGSQDIAYVDESNTETKLTEDPGDDAASLAGTDLAVYVGAGATSSTGGTIGAGNDVKVAFRVTIK